MEFLLLGFITSLSLILAIGAQNIFVIEQGLKRQYIFIVCLVFFFIIFATVRRIIGSSKASIGSTG